MANEKTKNKDRVEGMKPEITGRTNDAWWNDG